MPLSVDQIEPSLYLSFHPAYYPNTRRRSTASHIRNVVIVGAKTPLGKHIAAALLSSAHLAVTALSSYPPTPTSPTSATGSVLRTIQTDFTDHRTLVSDLQGQDALVIVLPPGTSPSLQIALIDAAAAAGVKYVLPNEWGPDTAHPFNTRSGLYTDKAAARARTHQRSMAYIAVVAGILLEPGLETGALGIDVRARTAHMLDDGGCTTTISTLAQVARAVERLLSLPYTGSPPCLDAYRNRHVYLSSFHISQKDVLSALDRATNTVSTAWSRTWSSSDGLLSAASYKVQNGDDTARYDWVLGASFVADCGGDFAVVKTAEMLNEPLGLPAEDLDQVISRWVQDARVVGTGL